MHQTVRSMVDLDVAMCRHLMRFRFDRFHSDHRGILYIWGHFQPDFYFAFVTILCGGRFCQKAAPILGALSTCSSHPSLSSGQVFLSLSLGPSPLRVFALGFPSLLHFSMASRKTSSSWDSWSRNLTDDSPSDLKMEASSLFGPHIEWLREQYHILEQYQLFAPDVDGRVNSLPLG